MRAVGQGIPAMLLSLECESKVQVPGVCTSFLWLGGYGPFRRAVSVCVHFSPYQLSLSLSTPLLQLPSLWLDVLLPYFMTSLSEQTLSSNPVAYCLNLSLVPD